MSQDPYVVLGISPAADPSEWKRAYRRLAMRWHPDRNNHPDATERFKEISAAYERLMAGESATEVTEDEADETSETVVRAADIRLNLVLSLEEGATGCRRTIRYTRGKACPTCAGSGEAGMARTRFCDACHGSGRVRDAARGLASCPDCGGRGFFSERICPDCAGGGREQAEVSLDIKVPPGMLSGDELRLVGQGEPGDESTTAGDLYLTIVLATHRLFELRGRDLHYRMPVGVLILLAGGEVELPVLTGRISHLLQAGGSEAREIKLPGQGYPGRGRHPAGDLLVTLEPVFPKNLSARQRRWLQQAHADMLENSADCLPEVDDWWRLQEGA